MNFELPDFEKLYFYMVLSLTCDQNLTLVKDVMKNEPLTPEFKLLALTAKIPWIIRRIIMWVSMM